MGLWKPTPKDIFKSRWKRFYKRLYRGRTSGNTVDRPTPHEQPTHVNDGVPSPWKLHYSMRNFGAGKPQDGRRASQSAYGLNVERYMRASSLCNNNAARDFVLRCLDRGQRGVSDSGLGRAETATWKFAADADAQNIEKALEPPGHVPAHVYRIIEGEAERSGESRRFLELLQGPESRSDTFAVKRLYQLCEEWELVWEGGRNDPRRPPPRRQLPDGSAEAKDRGRFPYVDEQASLMDELGLKEILRLAHKTSSRRHPKWREREYWFRKCHASYLRRRAMNEEEVKQRVGVLKASLTE